MVTMKLLVTEAASHMQWLFGHVEEALILVTIEIAHAMSSRLVLHRCQPVISGYQNL
jgi:hypothetical protein